MDIFLLSLGVIFLAELGDKTQLVALALSTRYRVGTTLLGITAATAAVHVVSVLLGELLGAALPADWVGFLAGVSFLVFGLWSLRGDDDDESGRQRKALSPFLLVFSTFFLAELGDKTMFSTVTLAAQSRSAVPVWLGSTLGMVAADGLAIAVGRLLGARLPEKALGLLSGGIFLAFGAWSAWYSGRNLPTWAWGCGALLLAISAALLFRPRRNPA